QEDESEAHGNHPLRDGGSLAPDRDPGAAHHAEKCGEAARPARRRRRCTKLRLDQGTAEMRNSVARTKPGVSASCRDGEDPGNLMSSSEGESSICARQSCLMRSSSTPSTTTPPITVRGTEVSPNSLRMTAWTAGVVASWRLYLIRLRARMSLTCLQ